MMQQVVFGGAFLDVPPDGVVAVLVLVDGVDYGGDSALVFSDSVNDKRCCDSLRTTDAVLLVF